MIKPTLDIKLHMQKGEDLIAFQIISLVFGSLIIRAGGFAKTGQETNCSTSRLGSKH